MTPAAPHENELYFLSFRITSSYIVTFTCTCNVHQKSKALLISSQSDGVKSLWISYHSVVSDGIWNAEKPCISKHFLALDVTSRCRIGATPKRNAGGSSPPRDASQQRGRWKISRFFSNRIRCHPKSQDILLIRKNVTKWLLAKNGACFRVHLCIWV